MNEIIDLIDISKYAGERFDLVQAGGGNASVKYDNDQMIIKASGFLLSDVNENTGYSRVITSKTSSIVRNQTIINCKQKKERESLASKLVKDATLDKKNRPSIETLLHSFLSKYTLHTHPIVVNMIVIQKDYKDILRALFKNQTIAIVEYQTPGIELAISLNTELLKFKKIPNIIFLQNHGLIVTSNNKDEIQQITEDVLIRIEKYLNIDMIKYKTTNKITSLLNGVDKKTTISYLSEDAYLEKLLISKKELFFNTPFCPDSLVYCGVSCCEIEDLFDIVSIQKYKDKYFELPKVIIYKNNLFFIAENVKKTKEMEEVFKFHIMVLKKNINIKINFLENSELSYLSQWEAERFRGKL
jgi:rhamnose utilization protein RhaD (predicted bifunctional aldolase and dehydrogenase)